MNRNGINVPPFLITLLKSVSPSGEKIRTFVSLCFIIAVKFISESNILEVFAPSFF